jgi:hypothetical protein
MAKEKKLDPRVQWMVESFNREPTAAEEADFYRRNAGGPIAAYPSLTRGRGFLNSFQPDAHLGAYWSHQLAQQLDREEEEVRGTYHHAHIDAFEAVHAVEWVRDFMARMQHQHSEHCRAYFYHLHPHHRPAWMLNPFLIDP